MRPSGCTPSGHVAGAPVSLVPLGCFIQQLLGHEKLETTSIYTQVSIEQLKQVHQRCHPSENESPEA